MEIKNDLVQKLSREDEKLQTLLQHPDEIGRMVGFKDLKADLHGEWIREMVYGTRDYTLQAHRGSYKSSCLAVAISLLLLIDSKKNVIFLRKTDNDVSEMLGMVSKILRSEVMNDYLALFLGSTREKQRFMAVSEAVLQQVTDAVWEEYPSGTKAEILKAGETWSKIQIGNRTGWMMTKFLIADDSEILAEQDQTESKELFQSGEFRVERGDQVALLAEIYRALRDLCERIEEMIGEGC